jgi:hypothetical protein
MRPPEQFLSEISLGLQRRFPRQLTVALTYNAAATIFSRDG